LSRIWSTEDIERFIRDAEAFCSEPSTRRVFSAVTGHLGHGASLIENENVAFSLARTEYKERFSSSNWTSGHRAFHHQGHGAFQLETKDMDGFFGDTGAFLLGTEYMHPFHSELRTCSVPSGTWSLFAPKFRT
jgi:hypothetical protein